ncbi:hypothetical protein N7539_005949 [Penicillium diatomitis]|uniref:Histone deacetylation protein Rxt3 n=1 Tax=Penicillium diatomitis TaxID=2819901 RepID=A0A9W9X5N3_9EURO|nr:uncharacterized protein N7539_005949 [Penicillium diatomitis]KAJ5484153.1 hypothetical protein N7539_005949 [Penicillium diatomitis]
MDLFRRFHQSSYPSRPSPLAGSQEASEDRARQAVGGFSTTADSRRRAESENMRPTGRYDYTSPTSHLYSAGMVRETQGTGGENAGPAISPPRNQPAPARQQHPRDHSHEPRVNPHRHRRNQSQPHSAPLREGPQDHPTIPAFGSRQMPPPSPPHAYGPRSQSANAAASSLLSREPSTVPPHRPGSSMSISAMLGSDSERPARETGPSLFSRPVGASIFGNPAPSNSFSRPSMGRPYRSGSSGGASIVGGVEQAPFGGLPPRATSSQYPEKPHSTHPSPQISASEPLYNEARRMSFSGPIGRTSSQPPNNDFAPHPPGYSPHSRPSTLAHDRYEAAPRLGPTYAGLDQHVRDNSVRYGNIAGDRRPEDTAARDQDRGRERGKERERDRFFQEGDSKGPLGGSFGPLYGEREPTERYPTASAWEQARSQPSSPETKRFPAPEPGPGFGFGAIQSYTKSLGSQPGGSRVPSLSVQTGPRQLSPTQREPPYSTKSQPHLARLGPTTFASPATTAPSLGLPAVEESGRRKGSEDLLHHRNLLSLFADVKRGGRASPLPQAVQGAQAPFIGPSGEPGIKNELGRVFSGIGSGVGGVTAGSSGSGPSTPLIASPFKRGSLTSRSVNGENEDGKIARPISATSQRRSRKSREEETPGEEAGAGSSKPGLTITTVTRETKKPPTGSSHRPSTNVSSGRTSAPTENTVGHHHHHHHHHHHAARSAAAVPASPLREPRTTVNLEPLLASVAHLPRHHLGSTLYKPQIDVPSVKASSESSKFGYTTTPRPLPRFDQQENCTFTVRVPRFRVDAARREEICARRALWGTGVYTDDSDPVAAAIHSGYIRGAWGDDVDESMLDLEIKDSYQHAPPPSTEEEGRTPRFPPVPPGDKDLHVTLLILPRVDRYESTVMFGLKSREWTGRHDGLSFKVHRVEWVDEGVGRGEERSGEARRKRLRTLMQTGRICTGPAMAKMDELRHRGVQVPRSMEGVEQPTPVQPVS